MTAPIDDYPAPGLDEAIARSGEWMHYCADAINAIRFDDWTQRTRAAASLYHVSVGHQAAIHVLTAHQLDGSAFALFRPQAETYERGLWLHVAATDQQVVDFLNGKKPPSRQAMLDSLPTEDGEPLKAIMNPPWSGLCDFTHGGANQIAVRMGPKGIDERFKPEHVASMLIASCTLLLLTMTGFSAICEDPANPEMLAAAYAAFHRVVRGKPLPQTT